MERKKKIGLILSNQRIQNSFSKYYVAKHSNLRISQITEIENGVKNYTINSLLAYMQVVGVKLVLIEE